MRVNNIALPKLEDFPSRAQWELACWAELCKSKELLSLITSVREKHDLARKAIALDLMFSGATYREIGEKTFLSSQTISGIKKALLKGEYESHFKLSKQAKKPVGEISNHNPRRFKRVIKTKYGKFEMQG